MQYNSIKDIIYKNKNEYFNISVKDGVYSSDLEESYYSKKLPDESFSYDVSNNKLIANIDEFGTIKNLSFYYGCYYCDDIPGVWVAKDFTQSSNFYFEIKVEDKLLKLNENKFYVESDLVDNIFPRVVHIDNNYRATVLAVAPISKLGKRLSLLIYGLYLENTSNKEMNVEIIMPKKYNKKYSDVRYVSIDIANNEEYSKSYSYKIKAKESVWVPVIFYRPGSYEDFKLVKEKGELYWINETYDYFKGLTGNLIMDNDKLITLIYERAVIQSLGAVGVNDKNEIVGSNWGTYPVLKRIWNKDMYYSMLPFSILDPEFYKKGILWFSKYGIRPKGSKYEGGIKHSITNSLSSIMMAGLYYETTDDKDFFLKNKNLFHEFINIIDETLNLKTNNNINLLPSIWISDAFSLGEYHTGSNIFVWKVLKSFSRICRDIFHKFDLSEKYDKYADKLKEDIEEYMTYNGVYGKQYVEGIGSLSDINKLKYPVEKYKKEFFDQGIDFLYDVNDGENINLLMHDGEESDTTLIPYYGYKRYDDEILRNYENFSASNNNPTYSCLSRGIKWGNKSGATFPGYITFLCASVDYDSMNGDNGYMTELKRLIDLDGSWWWWPYKLNSKTGNVERMNECGKCSWGSGVFSTIFITQFLGVNYDAPSKTLLFRPFSPSSNFQWENAKFGYSSFNLKFYRDNNSTKILVNNNNNYSITLNAEIIGSGSPSICETGEKLNYSRGKFLNNETVLIKKELLPYEKIEIILE